MKRLFLLFIIIVFLAGCGTAAKESEFLQHSSHFATWDHAVYSMGGYKNCDAETGKESKDQGWWGKTVTDCPTK